MTATACGGSSASALTSYSYDLANHLLRVGDNSAATLPPVSIPGGGSTPVFLDSFYYYDTNNRLANVQWDKVNTPAVPPISAVTMNHWYTNDNQRLWGTTTDNTYWSEPPNPPSTQTVSYTPNAVNQYTTVGSVSPTYDGNGNLTSDGTFTYGYDSESRLISASGAGHTINYAYDAQGRRKSKTVDGVTTVFVWDGDREVMEYAGNTVSGVQTAGDVLQRYVYGNGAGEVLSIVDGSGNRSTPVPDIEGSRIALIDGSTGTVTKAGYLPYGESSDPTSGAFRYAGMRIDAETNGLYYARARMYSPVLGRFLQPDPIGYAGGRNLYAYTGNDPLNAIDPSGLAMEKAYDAAGEGLALINPIGTAYAEDPEHQGQRNLHNLDAEAFGGTEILPNGGKIFIPQPAGLLVGNQTSAARAGAIQGVLNPRTQNSVTTAVTETQEGVRVVTSSEGTLRPAQRAALQPGEIAGVGEQGVHAEINGVNAARSAGLTPIGVAPSRPACDECERALQELGIPIIGP